MKEITSMWLKKDNSIVQRYSQKEERMSI